MQPDKETAQPEQSTREPTVATLPSAMAETATADAPSLGAGELPKPAAAEIVPEAGTTPAAAMAADPEPAAQARAAKTPDIVVEAKAAAVPHRSNPSWRTWSPKTWTPKIRAPKMPGWMPRSGRAKSVEPAKTAVSRAASRFPLLAASVALAACIGAAAGAAGVAGIGHLRAQPASKPQPVAAAPAARGDAEIKALRDAVAQLRGQMRSLSDGVTALRASTEGAGRNAQAQMAKLADTIDRLEKSQAEPLARLTKLAAAIERLERRDAATPASEVTGSVRAAAAPQTLQLPAKETRALRPVVEGWRLHEVQRGVALVEGRVGLAEVMVGDTLRGVGRVEDIRREDGRWVVVTSRGLILPAR